VKNLLKETKEESNKPKKIL